MYKPGDFNLKILLPHNFTNMYIFQVIIYFYLFNKVKYPLNGKSYSKPQQKLPHTSSSSSLESTYSSSSASYSSKPTSINPVSNLNYCYYIKT